MRIVKLDPDEELLTLAAAAKLLPRRRGGRPVHPSTLARWATRGVRGIYLPVLRVGSTFCTTRGALFEFLVESTQQLAEPRSTETQSARHADAIVDARLRAMGLLTNLGDARGPRTASVKRDTELTIPTRQEKRSRRSSDHK